MVGLLLSVTFACGVVIAVAHVANRRFVAPGYDVVANLTAFACAVAASLLLHHVVPAALSAVALGCWVLLARRTVVSWPRRGRRSRAVTASRYAPASPSRRPTRPPEATRLAARPDPEAS